mmetsp:Transcript_33525/g.85788  ORF Transcript_33525/g.85788 Transcript_33525/m.85788 type:complete len:94 (-) Transcript_33525:177-458(-)
MSHTRAHHAHKLLYPIYTSLSPPITTLTRFHTCAHSRAVTSKFHCLLACVFTSLSSLATSLFHTLHVAHITPSYYPTHARSHSMTYTALTPAT